MAVKKLLMTGVPPDPPSSHTQHASFYCNSVPPLSFISGSAPDNGTHMHSHVPHPSVKEGECSVHILSVYMDYPDD